LETKTRKITVFVVSIRVKRENADLQRQTAVTKKYKKRT
jgi:hypothetical protein